MQSGSIPTFERPALVVAGASQEEFSRISAFLEDEWPRLIDVADLDELCAHLERNPACAVLLCVCGHFSKRACLAHLFDALGAGRPMVVLVDEYRHWVETSSLVTYGTVPLVRPYTEQHLRTALRAALTLGGSRRRSLAVEPLVSYGPIALRLDTDVVAVDGKPMPKVRGVLYRLLRYMVLHADGPIAHDLLERDVWRAKVATKTLESHLSRLRSALGSAGSMIVTLPQGCALAPAVGRNVAGNTTSGSAKFR